MFVTVNGQESEAYCVYVRVNTEDDTNGVDQYIADQCYENRSASQLICQYDSGTTGKCNNLWML